MTYDYRKGADSLIRATEATVAERIPARTTIRCEASIELPHVMMLIDDRAKTVVEPLAAEKDALPVAYDHDLMQKSGHPNVRQDSLFPYVFWIDLRIWDRVCILHASIP